MELNEKYGNLPSKFQLRQVVEVQFTKGQSRLLATVRAIHFFYNQVKYDLGLWLGDGSVDDPERESRIYNVAEEFLTAA